MSFIRKAFLLLLLLAATFTAEAQHYNFKKYTTKNGLANPTVQQIIQDSEGFIWLATSGGLSRFDGKKFKNYYLSDGLLTNDITCLLEDKHKNLWVGTGTGLCKLSKGKFSSYILNGLNHTIYSICEDKEGIVWFTTKGGGLVNYDGKSFKQFTKKNGLPTDSLFSFLEDQAGNYWVGTYHFGVCKIAKEDFTTGNLKCTIFSKENGLSSNNIFCVLEIKPNVFYLGSTNGGVNIIDNNKIERLTIKGADETDYVASLHKDRRGNIWIGTWEHGLVKYANGKFTFYNEKNGLLSHLINSVFEDNEGNIWIGTDLGVNLFKNEAFINLNENDGLPSKFVQCVSPIANGNLLFGTVLGIAEWNGEKLRVMDEVPEFMNASIQSICTDDKQNIWIGTLDGVFVCSYKNKLKLEKQYYSFENSFIYPVSKILKTKSGKILVSTFGNGFFIFNKNEITHYGAKEGLKSESIYSLFEDKNETIWIATLQGGALKFDGKNFVSFTKKDGLVDNTILGIAQDKKGNLLFSSSEGGLSSYDGKKFHNYSVANGLLSNLISTVKVDKFNNIWLGTNAGLNKLVLTDYFDVDISKFYSDVNGLEGNEFGANSLFVEDNGIIWAGTTEGLSRFNNALDFPNTAPPNLILQEIRLAYEKVNWKNYADSVDPRNGLPVDLKLNYKNNHLTFEFQALTTDNNVRYRYMLEGLEHSWSPSTSSTEAIYANIPSGKDYIFRVQALNSDGIWSTKNIAYKFTIESPLWQRWWFILLSALAILASLFLFINYRTKRLAQEKKVLEEKVEERTLELKETNSKLNVAFTDIKDSINYAQRIQQAILPVEAKIKDVLPQSFILFKPRDVVSGDFYWFGTVEKNKEVLHIIAAADCTGHGVPGAFMSMIGNTILNEIVVTKEITNPSEILSQLHNGVRTALKQNQNTSRDGMDICLCCINAAAHEITYAGAFNPLWILRNDRSVEIIKATKSAIGGFTSDTQVFESHKLQLQKGESIYLFTDGYADQFGGENGKKLTTKKFRDAIIDLYDKSMPEQSFYLNNLIEIWRGNEFQVDDILVIGIRL